MKKLLKEKIIKTEEQPLSGTDLSILTAKRNKQLSFLLYSYIPLAAILLYVFIDGIAVISREKFPYQKMEFSDEEEARFHLVAPYVCAFLFLLLTIFFIRFYLQTLAPLIKDVKQKKKLLLHYIPEKTEMAFFNRYYLSSPVVKKQQVEISREDFMSLPQQGNLVIEVLPHSQTILRFTNNGKEIKVS
jgi:hypothetical protein